MSQPSSAIAATFLLLGLAACRQEEKRDVPPPPTVSVAQVQVRTIAGGVEASGRLIPREEVAIAPELSGYRIDRVLVEENSQVTRGQILAVLDDTLLRSQIAQARATLDQQQVAYEKARMDAGRVAGLDDQGVLSQEAIDQRRIAERSALASVKSARAQLQDLLVRQERMVIRAPVSGRILQRQARPGEPSSSATILFTIARDSLIELEAEVPEPVMKSLSVGEPVKVTLASGDTLDGEVRLTGARVSTQTGLSTARIALPIRDELRSGGFAKARFLSGGAPALTVPEGAVHYDADGAYMLLLDSHSRVHRSSVTTGKRAAGIVELRSGAANGERAVMGGGAFVLEGDEVRIAKKTGR